MTRPRRVKCVRPALPSLTEPGPPASNPLCDARAPSDIADELIEQGFNGMLVVEPMDE
jgi:hypothetical protein